jgi:hypothetical protein
MTEHLNIWNALAKTDPSQTKPFNRSGGFKGTAIKPIWILKRLTEQFGPAGVGWGVNQPSFETVHCGEEILVYCTVSVWHGQPDNVLWGVGGDKVMAKRQSGAFCDDEAFKKAFTDAVNNAVKSIGVAADVHMGLFDDDKYVTQAKAEFAEEPKPPQYITDGQRDQIIQLAQTGGVTLNAILKRYGVPDLRELPATALDEVLESLRLTIEQKSKPKQAANA